LSGRGHMREEVKLGEEPEKDELSKLVSKQYLPSGGVDEERRYLIRKQHAHWGSLSLTICKNAASQEEASG